MRNHSYENDLDLHENEPVCRTHFSYERCTLILIVMKPRHERARKWPKCSADGGHWSWGNTCNINKTGSNHRLKECVRVLLADVVELRLRVM